jgi:hypothetical protein
MISGITSTANPTHSSSLLYHPPGDTDHHSGRVISFSDGQPII